MEPGQALRGPEPPPGGGDEREELREEGREAAGEGEGQWV